MTEIQTRKRKLETDIKTLIEEFHKENPGYEVYRVVPISEKTTTHKSKETYQEITNVKLTTDIQVL
jgi:hypothetical protein